MTPPGVTIYEMSLSPGLYTATTTRTGGGAGAAGPPRPWPIILNVNLHGFRVSLSLALQLDIFGNCKKGQLINGANSVWIFANVFANN